MLTLRRGLYYGWLVLAAVSSINFANAVTSIGVLSIFVIPMSEEFDWTRTQISGATSLGAVLGALSAPILGRLSDRLGSRIILTAGGVLIVLAAMYLSAMQTLVGFYAAFGIARLADQGFVQAVSPPAVAKWFLRYRGRALAALFFATSAGGVALPLLAAFVIDQWDWRVAWAVLSGIMLIIGVIPCALLVRRQPEDMGLQVDGRDAQEGPESMVGTPSAPKGAAGSSTGDGETEWRLGEAVRTPTLWLILVSGFMVGIGSTGIQLHMVPYLLQQGLDSATAVGVVSASFLASAIGNLFWGLLAERLSVRHLLTSIYALRAVSVVILLAVSSPAEAYAFAVLRGLTEGGIATVTTILLGEYYGRRYLGSLYGLERAIQVSGYAVGPLIAGIVYDINQSYTGAFVSFLFVTIAGALLIYRARRPVKTYTTR